MKIIFSINLWLVVSFFNVIIAQRGSISGVVTDRITGDSIPFSTVAAMPITVGASTVAVVSDITGSFRIENILIGNYDLIVSFIGYEADTIKGVLITQQLPDVNIGIVMLNPRIREIDAVEVKAMAQTVVSRIDRVTYNTADFETAMGGNAIDVLNRLPSLSVDANGLITVRGTSDFLVYLNGKPTQIESSMLLAQIPAETIESIDVITIPTARYDAQGKGGIINITTRTTGGDGFSFTVNALAGGAPWGNYSTTVEEYKMNDDRYGGSLGLLYSKERVTLFGNLYYNFKNVNGTRPGYARLLQDNGSYYHITGGGERLEWYKYLTSSTGIDYQINSQSNISAAYFYGNRSEGRSALYTYNNYFGDINSNPISEVPVDEIWIYNPNVRDRTGIFHTISLDFQYKTDVNSDLKISALYEYSKLNREMDNKHYEYIPVTGKKGELLEHFLQADNSPLNGYLFSVDYSKTLFNGHVFSTGIQPQFLEISGSFTYDTLNVNSSLWGNYADFENSIRLSRNIYSGYLDYSGDFGKLNFIAGLRLEYTDQLMKIENPEYFSLFDRSGESTHKVTRLDWFPSLHLDYEITDFNRINMAASRRISRPALANMTPFLYREHYEVYVVGDPALKPEYLTTYEITFNQKINRQNLSLTGFYRAADNVVFRVNTVYSERNLLIRSYTNSAKTKSLGLELSMNLVTGSFARFILSGSLYHYQVEGDIFGYKENNRSTNWSIKANSNFILSESLRFTFDFDLRSATVTAQGKNDMFYMANAAMNYTPSRLPKWEFSLKALDFLGSNLTAINTRAYNSNGVQIFLQDIKYDRQGPIVEFSLKYSLERAGRTERSIDSTFGREQF